MNTRFELKLKNCALQIDCDESAVEVTKMSLALKIVDGSNPLAWNNIGVFGERILRDIAQNIKLGNTLVSGITGLTPDEALAIKPIDLISAFQDVFALHGGFSYVIGNPPYVETKHYKAALPIMHRFLSNSYVSFEGKADLAVLFIERCMDLLSGTGKLGFIIQRRWFKTEYGKAARRMIADGQHLEKLIDFQANDISIAFRRLRRHSRVSAGRYIPAARWAAAGYLSPRSLSPCSRNFSSAGHTR